MADTAPKDFSTTAANNSTVGGINIAEGSTAAQLNDAIRAVLAVIANPDFGTLAPKTDTIAESTAAAGVTIDGLLIKDGALPNLTLGDVLPVGTPLPTFASTPSTGYLMMNGDTLGNASSGADQDSADYEALFEYLWDNISDTYAAVSTGRGASAAADWAANKTITIPNVANRAFFGAGDTYAAGETFGAATHTLTQAQLPDATIFTAVNGSASGGSPNLTPTTSILENNDKGDREAYHLHGTGGTPDVGLSSPLGDGDPHNNVPPGIGVYYQIKY